MKKNVKKICFYLLIFSFFNYTSCYSETVLEKDIIYSGSEKESIDNLIIVTSKDKRIEINNGSYQVLNDKLDEEETNNSDVKDYNQTSDIKIDEVSYFVNDDTLYISGINKTNTIVYGQNINFKIALDDIKIVEIEEPDYLATAGCLIGSAGLALLLLLLIAAATYEPKSCEGPKSVSDEW